MNDSTLMKIPDGIDDGTDDISGFLLCVNFLFHDLLIQFTSGQIFQNQVNILFVSVEVVELYNVRMADVFHDVNFSLQQNLFLLVHLLSELLMRYFFMIFIATGFPVFFYLAFTTFA